MSVDLRAALEAVRTKRGELTPQNVVDEARPEDHPLHHKFEWDDRVAGEEYRKSQARELIRSVRVSYRAPSGDEHKVRAFHSVRTPTSQAYEPVEEIAEDPFKRQMVLRQMEIEWRAMWRRYSHFEEFTQLVRGDLDQQAG